MLDIEINNWTDAIVNFFEVEVKKSELFKLRVSYLDKKKAAVAEKEEPKKAKKLLLEKQALDELLKVRRQAISEDIKAFVSKWVLVGKIPPAEKLITKVTHPLKYSYSADLNTGICEKNSEIPNYVSTASITNKSYDLVHHNGPIINLVRFLSIEFDDGEMIYDLILSENFRFLDGFNLTKKEEEQWQQRLSSWVSLKAMNTAGRAKQIYFPITSIVDDLFKYHLLIPLHSSTLSYGIYKKIDEIRISETYKEIKKMKENEFYHHLPSINYLKIAALEYGDGNANNISLRNSEMKGMGYLLPASAPSGFNKKIKPIFNSNSIFGRAGFNGFLVNETLGFMGAFLVRFNNINLSIKDPKKMTWLHSWCDQIIDKYFFVVVSMQELKSGWSIDERCTLANEYKILLDPFRKSEELIENFDNGDWQRNVINDFASWLNRELEASNEKFTSKEIHLTIWKSRFEPKLREHCDEIKQLRKIKEFQV